MPMTKHVLKWQFILIASAIRQGLSVWQHLMTFFTLIKVSKSLMWNCPVKNCLLTIMWWLLVETHDWLLETNHKSPAVFRCTSLCGWTVSSAQPLSLFLSFDLLDPLFSLGFSLRSFKVRKQNITKPKPTLAHCVTVWVRISWLMWFWERRHVR